MAGVRFFEMREIDRYEDDDDARRLLEQGVDLDDVVAQAVKATRNLILKIEEAAGIR